jgi:thiamine biosynthesis lipoprotein
MATWFEAWLVGDDEEHLTAVGEAALDEVERVEQLLSRFDRAAELFRVNREAARGPVLVSRDLFDTLTDCARWVTTTDGFFDPTLGGFADCVRLDEATRTVTFVDEDVRLDLGAYGKGYALDAAARVLERFGVASFLIHGGTSSVLACGTASDGRPWDVAIGDPFEAERPEIARVGLVGGLSTSATLDAQHASPDIIDPMTRVAVAAPAAYSVLAATATEAEVLSTALAAMGPERADAYLRRRVTQEARKLAVCRLMPGSSSTEATWLRESG